MSTSWRSSFPVLPAPHTTPVSTNPKSLRRPIHNPYDKFTKPEFDEWIGGITSALRRALGEETEEDVALDRHQPQDVYAAAEETFQDQSFEDSFADIQSRRTKGKAKDPREGPGLGVPQNPIELLSDSESGSDVESDEWVQEGEYEDCAEREEGGYDVGVEPEAYDGHDQAGHWTLNSHHRPIDPQVDRDDVEEISSREESPEIIEIDSNGQGGTGASAHGAGYSGAQYDRVPQLPPDDVEDELDFVGAANEQESQLDVEVEDFPPSTTQRQPSPLIDLPDPWQGPRTYAEDFYAGGDFSPQDVLNGVSPSCLTPVHDIHADTYFSHTVQHDESLPGAKSEPAVINVDVVDDALPDSSPPPSSPIEQRSSHNHVDDYQLSSLRSTHEEPDNILDHLYRDAVHMSQDEQQMILNSSFEEFRSGATSTSQAYIQPGEHLDWNWPPAFPRGKFASRAGHLESSPSRMGDDDFEEARNDDIIDLDAERNDDEDEDGSDQVSEGPIPLGTSDLVYADVDEGQDEHGNDRGELDEQFVEVDDIRATHDSQFPLPVGSRLSASEHAAMESFLDLFNSREVSPANAIEHVETMLADISGVVTDPIGRDVTSPQSIDEAGDKYLFSVPSEVLESVDGESQELYSAESSSSIEQIKAPVTEIQDQFKNVTSESVEESPLPSAVPTSAVGDTPTLTEEQHDKLNAEPIYMVVEMEAAAPVSRGVSEAIEVVPFAGEVLDIYGEYVVEEPPTTEPSAEPEDELRVPVDVVVETVPVTPKLAPVELSSSDNCNASPFPMPIFGDPSAPDPIISSEAKHPQQTPPRLVNLTGTPRINISQHSTPSQPTPGQPTPASVPVSTSMLHAFSRRVSPSEGSSGPSGLFTPMEGELISESPGDAFDISSLPHSGLPLLSADDVLASVATALAEEPRAGSDTPMINESVTVAEQSPVYTGDHQDANSELAEDTQLGAFHPLSFDDDGENEDNQSPLAEPDAGLYSVENSMVTSLKSEEVQQAASTTQTAVDKWGVSCDEHPKEVLVSAEAPPANVPGLAHSSPLLSSLIDQDPFQLVVHNDQVPPGTVAGDDNREDTVSQSGLGSFTNIPGRANDSPAVDEPDRSHDADDQGSQTKPLKRKRVSPVQPTSRLTRSMSDKISAGNKKSQGGRKAGREKPVRDRRRKLLDVKDSGSDAGSVSSGASTAVRMLQFASTDGSRASSIVSTSPSDSSSIQHPLIPPLLFHAHGAIHHRHGPPALPPVPVQTKVHIKAASPEPSHDPEGRKDLPSASAVMRTPSAQQIATSTSSPVTRSHCRFHKISLPKEEGGPRICFVVPGCSLGDKELMDEEEIQDHGPATHEDYSHLVGNIEVLDFNPYLVGVLRQLVGVDLLRENEVFYLLQPGEEVHYKKKGRKSTTGSKLASSTIARSSPASPQVSVASRHSLMTSISRPPVSNAGSMATSFGSSLSEVQSHKHSSLFSASDEELSGEEGNASPKSKRRRKEAVAAEGMLANEEGGNVFQDPEMNGPRVSSRILKRTRSKRQVGDAAAYKPRSGDEDDSDGGADRLDKGRRKVKKSKAKKRPRVADEEENTQAKRQKQKRVHE